MKTLVSCFVFTLIMFAAALAPAQSQLTLAQALDTRVSIVEKDVIPAAEAMPEDKYSFVPTAGEFAGVRSFAQQVKHLSACNYRMSAYIMGQTPTPEQESETGPDSAQTKAQIMEYLRGSYAALHRAVATITPENQVKPLVRYPGPSATTRLQLVVLMLAHANDHYGQMVEYLRMNGIVPPGSRK